MRPVPPFAHYLPALAPVVLALALAVFWAPPQISPDTATGLLAWKNYASGGTWNTLALPDPTDIARTVEEPVTWWSPGQYAPLGLLVSASLSLGNGMILLALISALSTVTGCVLLARSLGAPPAAWPWIAAAVAGTWHGLYPFGMFIGGEVVQIALWPWVALVAWQVRDRPLALIGTLPPLLLVGTLGKHAFAIWALALLTFVWIERLRPNWRGPAAIWRATWPVVAAGLAYLLLRTLALPPSSSSPSDPDQLHRTFALALGFNAHAPLLAATGAGSVIGRAFFLRGLDYEDGWNHLALVLAVGAPLSLVAYGWLALRNRALERFAGIVALVGVGVLLILMWRGGSISLEDRHHRPAGLLLLMVVAAAGASSVRQLSILARFLVVTVVIFGIGASWQRHRTLHRLGSAVVQRVSIPDLSIAAARALQQAAASASGTDAIVYLPNPVLTVAASGGRLLVTDAVDRDSTWIARHTYRGRVSAVLLVLPTAFASDDRAASLRASFLDYRPQDWTHQRIDGWDFWQAGALARPPS